MNNSRRIKRMSRNRATVARMNLTSLMDVFTILVFFLLVNSSDGEVLPTHNSIALPESVSEENPRITVTIMVNEDSILLHGKVIESVKTLLSSPDDSSESLVIALNENKRRSLPAKEATIMGDREIPYRLLKKVIASCTEAGFERISLAVLQVKSEAG